MHELRTVNYLSNREYESQASTADLFISRVIRRGSRDSSRVRVGLVGARLRRHKVAGEQVGGRINSARPREQQTGREERR